MHLALVDLAPMTYVQKFDGVLMEFDSIYEAMVSDACVIGPLPFPDERFA